MSSTARSRFYVRDPVRRRLVIARDPAGRIPLYYRQTEGGLVFSTDLDEIERLSRSPGEIDVGSLNFYLALRHIPAPRTIFRDVCKVPAGHALVFDTHSGKLSEIDNRALPSSEVCCGDEVELVLELGELFQDAVGKRLRGGESPAVLLSGGLDSSLVAALVSELSPEPVRTFTVGYMHRGYDERLYAKLVSDRLDTDHREVVVEPARKPAGQVRIGTSRTLGGSFHNSDLPCTFACSGALWNGDFGRRCRWTFSGPSHARHVASPLGCRSCGQGPREVRQARTGRRVSRGP